MSMICQGFTTNQTAHSHCTYLLEYQLREDNKKEQGKTKQEKYILSPGLIQKETWLDYREDKMAVKLKKKKQWKKKPTLPRYNCRLTAPLEHPWPGEGTGMSRSQISVRRDSGHTAPWAWRWLSAAAKWSQCSALIKTELTLDRAPSAPAVQLLSPLSPIAECEFCFQRSLQAAYCLSGEQEGNFLHPILYHLSWLQAFQSSHSVYIHLQ